MSTSSSVSTRSSALLSIIFFLPAVILYILWNIPGIRSGRISRGEKIDYFMEYFPGWMQSMTGIHLFSIMCCIIAITFAARSFKKKKLWIRLLMLMVVFVSIFILMFDIYQVLA